MRKLKEPENLFSKKLKVISGEEQRKKVLPETEKTVMSQELKDEMQSLLDGTHKLQASRNEKIS